MDANPKVAPAPARTAHPPGSQGNNLARPAVMDLLRAYMDANRLRSIVELAKVIDADPGAVGRWLSGQGSPSLDALRRMAPRLGVALDRLMVAAEMATAEEFPGLAGVAAADPPPPEVATLVTLVRDETIPRGDRAALARTVGQVIAMWEELRHPAREPRMRRRP